MPTYGFQNCSATIIGPGGVFQLGYGAGVSDEGITIDFAEDRNTMVVGADGSVMHSLHAAKHGNVTVRLLKTSPTNHMLSVMAALQFTMTALHGINIISVTDHASGDTILCRACAFKKPPALTFGKDAGTHEWAFHAGMIDEMLGTLAA